MCGDRLYAVGGIDSRLTVSTTEYLQIGSGIAKAPIQPTEGKRYKNNKNQPPSVDECPISEWTELRMTEYLEDMIQGGGASIVSIGDFLYALSIYGTLENDRICDTKQPGARYTKYSITELNCNSIFSFHIPY